jgi:uncharacterized protein (DUF1330 family)
MIQFTQGRHLHGCRALGILTLHLVYRPATGQEFALEFSAIDYPKRRTIMSAYIVFTRTKTLDQKELETYWAGIQATMKGHPIEVLVAYGKHEVLEGDPIEGIVIAKFQTAKAAKDWYYGEAYQSVAKHRQKGAIYQGLIVEGVI